MSRNWTRLSRARPKKPSRSPRTNQRAGTLVGGRFVSSMRFETLYHKYRLEARTSSTPFLDSQSRDCGKVAVGGHDCAVSQAQGNCSDHDVDDLHGPSAPTQVGPETPKLRGGFF